MKAYSGSVGSGHKSALELLVRKRASRIIIGWQVNKQLANGKLLQNYILKQGLEELNKKPRLNGYLVDASIFAQHACQTRKPLLVDLGVPEWPKFCLKPLFASKKPIFARHCPAFDVAKCAVPSAFGTVTFSAKPVESLTLPHFFSISPKINALSLS
ncbi:hypothetical protein I2I05_09015 [Hymenobacter sp. BT683]|uniref:Uncharacterized protein n=1 Tax=Hymenobacter jeongseonensis TaxID=2791027 RepID=A0ABS0IGQ0_9BACT|nr:hypothetical protein [Hymenobacter jeongseonensis]MBF9237534.1 hypothetical protein [Hymenobacter jeongseonensis]